MLKRIWFEKLRAFWREEDSGQALVEFAVAMPLQLLVTFGIMQMALLYVSTLMVDYTAYRCARAALVGEHERTVEGQFVVTDSNGNIINMGDQYRGTDMVASILLAPITGRSFNSGAGMPPRANIPGWGEVPHSDVAGWKARVVVTEEPVDSDNPDSSSILTATVVFNQELVFPVVDTLFAYIMKGDKEFQDANAGDVYAFGDVDQNFQSTRSGEVIDFDSNRGRIRIIGGRTHFAITRKCSLAADMGWRGDLDLDED